MLRAIQEPLSIDIFHRYTEGSALTSVVPAGTIVMKTGEDTVQVSDGTSVLGVLSQNVFPRPGSQYFLPYLNYQAYDGDPVGVYRDAGVFLTDQFVEGTYTPGSPLYVTNKGQLTDALDDVSATAGNINVGEVIRLEGDLLLFHFNGHPTVTEVPSD